LLVFGDGKKDETSSPITGTITSLYLLWTF